MNGSVKRPEIRCGLIQSGFKALQVLGPTVKQKIIDRYPPATLKTVLQGKENDWVPLEFDLLLSECIMAEINEEEYYQFCIKTTIISIETSVVGPFIRSTLHLLKVSISSILKLAPRLWNSCYRNCGTLSIIEKQKGCIHIILDDLPPVFFESEHYMIPTAGFIHAMAEFAGGEKIKVSIEQKSKTNRKAVLSITWDQGK